MRPYFNAALFSLLLTALIAAGCTDQPLAPEPPNVRTHDSDAGPLVSRFRFTGRDSFGVALKARVAVAPSSGPDRCASQETVYLMGTGTATHLGRIRINEGHCLEGSLLTEERFTIIGTTGAQISGT